MRRRLITIKVFIYDDLLFPDRMDALGVQPLNEQIAETVGKMHWFKSNIIMLNPDDLVKSRGNRKVFGALYDLPDDEQILQRLDAYYGISEARTGISHPHDLCYRTTTIAYPIYFNNIHEFANFKFKYGKKEECYIYMSNLNHPQIIHAVTKHRHCRLSNGFYKKGFINLLTRHNYEI